VGECRAEDPDFESGGRTFESFRARHEINDLQQSDDCYPLSILTQGPS
jgi:hypothetical protein